MNHRAPALPALQKTDAQAASRVRVLGTRSNASISYTVRPHYVK